jgi:hypothetical protein
LETPDWNAIVVFTFLSVLVLMAVIGGIIEWRHIEVKKNKGLIGFSRLINFVSQRRRGGSTYQRQSNNSNKRWNCGR